MNEDKYSFPGLEALLIEAGVSNSSERNVILNYVSNLEDQYGLQERIDEHHKLDAAAKLDMNIYEWSLHRESELTATLNKGGVK